ncbi:unnamed protein product [Arctia plantaginis]|uniref:Uncharacterized protein n=1 Tax=Arctia plantaginis TaxID=874455 RepID=A0A8S1ADG9_ARCPL|nr:unnamed protein product [Arctia plantaginis]CAB3243359.1 unnamed protein product [Arctia plantaginis]
MASTVCVSRCRLLAKLEINRGLCLSPIFRDLSNSRESWCRRWRPTRRCFFTSACAHGSKATSKVDIEKSEGKDLGQYIRASNNYTIHKMHLI